MNKRIYVFLMACLLSAVFLLTGLLKGQQADVFAKAIRICLECVGIG